LFSLFRGIKKPTCCCQLFGSNRFTSVGVGQLRRWDSDTKPLRLE